MKSDIFYSIQNEDYRSEELLLNSFPDEELSILLIASSGENLLSLCANPRVFSLTAVDTNPAQLNLCMLRYHSALYLDRDSHMRFFASDANALDEHAADDRVELYRSFRGNLDVYSRLYWDERLESEIRPGLHFCGRNDAMARMIQAELAQYDIHPLDQPVASISSDQFIKAFENVYTVARIKEFFNIEGDVAAQRIASQATTIARCYLKALSMDDAHLNYFLHCFFKNSYIHNIPNEAGLPAYLHKHKYALLQDKLQDIEFILMNEPIQQAIKYQSNLHLLSVSNIPDWLTKAAFEELGSAAAQGLQKDGLFLARKATGEPSLVESLSSELNVVEELCEQVRGQERAPMWTDVLVATPRR